MVSGGYVPDKGDIIWLNFSPQVGHEQAGHRPALVLSPQEYNARTGLALLCPITSSIKGYPFEVTLPPNISVAGVVLADQVKSQDWRARGARYECPVPQSVVGEVLARIDALLQ